MHCRREVEDAVDVAKNYAHADRTSAALYTISVCRRDDLAVWCEHPDPQLNVVSEAAHDPQARL
jgi:hypothetical protein